MPTVRGLVVRSRWSCMMVAGAYALNHGVKFEDPAQMANALVPMVGEGIRIAVLL